jgi:hypothetical protein
MLEKEVLLVTCTSLQIQSYTEALWIITCKILQIIFVLLTPQYTEHMLSSTSGMKRLPDIVIFTITKLYLMCILVHLITSWIHLCMYVATWHPILFDLTHFLFPFYHYLHNTAYISTAQPNKTPIIMDEHLELVLGAAGWLDSEM